MSSRREFMKFSIVAPFVFSPLFATTNAPFLLTKANEREYIKERWMDLYQSFHYYNYDSVEDMGYGILRIIDDATIHKMTGTPKHPHKNMEILTVVFDGVIFHEDSLGNSGVMRGGDIQLMSAGEGIEHAETNPSRFSDVHGLQIWLSPKERNTKPSYQSKTLKMSEYTNRLLSIVSPNKEGESLQIKQDAYIYRGYFDRVQTVEYQKKFEQNGLYIFVIDGEVRVDKTPLKKRDGLGIKVGKGVNLELSKYSEILLFDIPMEGNF